MAIRFLDETIPKNKIRFLDSETQEANEPKNTQRPPLFNRIWMETLLLFTEANQRQQGKQASSRQLSANAAAGK